MPGVERPPGLSSLVSDKEVETLREKGYNDEYIVKVLGPLIEDGKLCSPSSPRPKSKRDLIGPSPPFVFDEVCDEKDEKDQ